MSGEKEVFMKEFYKKNYEKKPIKGKDCHSKFRNIHFITFLHLHYNLFECLFREYFPD